MYICLPLWAVSCCLQFITIFLVFLYFSQFPTSSIKSGIIHIQLCRRFAQRYFFLTPKPIILFKFLRHLLFPASEPRPPLLCRRNSFCLSLSDKCAFRLCHIRQNLQHQIRNKYPHQISMCHVRV